MNRKTSIVALTLLIVGAVALGLLLLNKGDGPVSQVIIADRSIDTAQDFETAKSSDDSGVFIVLDKEFNKFKEDIRAGIPAEKDIYANVYFVECPKGSLFTAKWINEDKTVKEDIKELTTDKRGVVSFLLEGSKLGTGSCKFEIYSDGKKLFEYVFSAK